MKFFFPEILLSFAALAILLSACGGPRSEYAQTQARLQATERLKSGKLIQALEAFHTLKAQQLKNEDTDDEPPRNAAPQLRKGGDHPDCDLPKGAEHLSLDEMKKAMTIFGGCIRKIFTPIQIYDNVLNYLRRFERDAEGLKRERPVGDLTEDELASFFADRLVSFEQMIDILFNHAQGFERLRKSFSTDDLADIQKIAVRRRARMMEIEKEIFALVDQHRALIELFDTNNRYAALLALRDSAADLTGREAIVKLDFALGEEMQRPVDGQSFPKELLHPFAIRAIVPSEGKELSPLDPTTENPFTAVSSAIASFGGSEASVRETIKRYQSYRDIDNPKLPEHLAPDEAAARVAFLDSGVDFRTFPELGEWLSLGRKGEQTSHDYADFDENPWIPYELGNMGHGSTTLGSFLTVLSQYAGSDELGRGRKLDVAFWKTDTIRSALDGNDGRTNPVAWQSQEFASQYALIDHLQRASDDSIQPKVLSISLSFGMNKVLNILKKPELLLHAPWLWVMSAGNRGRDVSTDETTCLSDLPSDQRPSKKILCVGALKSALVHDSDYDRIASYSNTGDLVDVYAYESYQGLCPGGTSCSTPAVSAIAALLAIRYPWITPEQIKLAIVGASDERDIAIDGKLPRDERRIRVFDPSNKKQVEKALEIASHFKRYF